MTEAEKIEHLINALRVADRHFTGTWSENGSDHKIIRDALQNCVSRAPTGLQTPDYFAWLIEINDETGGPKYFSFADDDEEGPDWLRDHNAALHFCRKADAEQLIEYFGWTRAKAVEHMWPANPKPTTSSDLGRHTTPEGERNVEA